MFEWLEIVIMKYRGWPVLFYGLSLVFTCIRYEWSPYILALGYVVTIYGVHRVWSDEVVSVQEQP